MSQNEKQQKDDQEVNKKHVQYELLNFTENMLETEKFDEVFKSYPVTEDTKCGFGLFQGSWLQIFANKKAFVFFYGVVGSIFAATYAYFNGTITTIEKRYKIPSRNTGIISIGNDISSLFISAVLAYYAGKGHRPRWIAFGLFAIVLFCFLTALPHFLYGSGSEAEKLTVEFGAEQNFTYNEILKKQSLCRLDIEDGSMKCEQEEGNLEPQIILFLGQLVAGIGQSLYYTLGTAYIDDNVKKSKTPALISLSYFLRLLGPAGGYALASFCLKIYISPDLTPTIDNKDPRWLGAWWMGWLILGVSLFLFAFVMCMFPKQLPRAALRKRIASERRRRGMKKVDPDEDEKVHDEIPASLSDMMVTFKRLVGNTVFMLNNLASIFYYFGYMPYWIFTPKYIELQYKQSASTSSLVTGTVALVFSAIGILSSGVVISKFKPKARTLALWNVFVGFLSIVGMIGYSYLGCDANENSLMLNFPINNTISCNSNCHCDYVKYSPVCGSDNLTYISACHAGCETTRKANGTEIFENCSCIAPSETSSFSLPNSLQNPDKQQKSLGGGTAIGGSCLVDCKKEFILFLIVMCFIKFTSATGRASNFLVSVRCVEERDKTVSMGFGLMFMCLFSFIPSPIFFGYLFDKFCLVWGKTCTGQGNCWLYDGESLRYWMNYIAAAFVTVGVLFDAGVWCYVKNLKIFDDETKEIEIVPIDKKLLQENERRASLAMSVDMKSQLN